MGVAAAGRTAWRVSGRCSGLAYAVDDVQGACGEASEGGQVTRQVTSIGSGAVVGAAFCVTAPKTCLFSYLLS